MAILTGGPLGSLNLRNVVTQALEPETVTYFAAMSASSESYWPGEVELIDTLIKRLKADGIWSIPKTLWFPVGETIAGATRYLKHPQGVGYKGGNVGFTQMQWNRLVGLDGRGVSYYLDTLTTEVDYAPSTDTHLMVAVESDVLSGQYRDIGSRLSDSFQMILNFSGGSYYRSFSPGSGLEGVTPPSASSRGVVLGTRKNSTAHLYLNSTSLVSQSATQVADTPSSTFKMCIFTAAAEGTASNKILSAASIGGGFEPAQYQLYQAAINSARTARAALTSP